MIDPLQHPAGVHVPVLHDFQRVANGGRGDATGLAGGHDGILGHHARPGGDHGLGLIHVRRAVGMGLEARIVQLVGLELPFIKADLGYQMAAQIASVAGDFQPVPKGGMPEDIAKACLFLASDASAFISGTHLVVDGAITIGGRHAWDAASPSPLLTALGISPEQAEQMRLAMASQ